MIQIGDIVLDFSDPAVIAGAVAAALDAAPPDGVVGTLAGDDTVVVIADDSIGGGAVAETIMGILEA